MSDKPFDPTKPCRTRDGRAARIICADAKSKWPIVALVEHSGGEYTRRFCEAGFSESCRAPDDLVNIPIRVSYWTKIYERHVIGAEYTSARAAAAQMNTERAVAYLEIIFEDDLPVAAHIHPGDEPAR
jgi:hypothetical protein